MESEDDFISQTYQRMVEATAGQFRSTTRITRVSKHDSPGKDNDLGSANTGWSPPPGFPRSRGVLWSHPRALGNVIGSLAQSRQWQESLSLGTVIARWPEIVGPQVARHCSVTSIEEGKLHIHADSTAWSKQLRLLLPQIERRIAETVGSGQSPQVVIHGPQSPSWKHGMYSVKGRGPRDTYG